MLSSAALIGAEALGFFQINVDDLGGGLVGVHQEQDAEHAPQRAGHVHLVAAEEGDVGPAEFACAGGGEVGVEVAGGGEEGAGHGIAFEAVGLIIRVRSTWVLVRMDSAVFSSMEVAPRTPRAVMTVAPRRLGRR